MDSVTSFDDYDREDLNFDIERNCFTFFDKEVDIKGECERDSDEEDTQVLLGKKRQAFW